MEKRDLEQLIQEWKNCREEMQAFNGHLTRLRLQGPVVFLTFIGASTVALTIEFNLTALLLAIGATAFISIIWGIDWRLSWLMVTISKRARKIERTPGIRFKLSQDIHHAWASLSWLRRRLDEIMYVFLAVCGGLVSMSIVLLKFCQFAWLGLTLGGVYLAGIAAWVVCNERLYHEEIINV